MNYLWIIFVKYDSHEVGQLPSWPWTQACASHPRTRCTGTWSLEWHTHLDFSPYVSQDLQTKTNGVLVEIRTLGLLGHLTLIQEQRRPLPAGRGGWPLSFWQNVRDRGQVLDGVVQSSYNLPYLSDRSMWTSRNCLWKYIVGSQLSFVWTRWNYSFSLIW